MFVQRQCGVRFLTAKTQNDSGGIQEIVIVRMTTRIMDNGENAAFFWGKRD